MAYEGDKSHARVLSPEAFCFIIDMATDDRLEFQLMPDAISETKTAIYNEVPILGRSLPLLGYSSSTSRQMGLALNFVALNSLKSGGKYTVAWVKDQVRWLESKVYPEYVDGFVFPPPLLLLVIGGVIGTTVVMNSCTTTWMGPWDVSTGAAMPFRASVEVQFQEWGLNDGPTNHPHDHTDAKESKNQWGPQDKTSAPIFIDIPLGI